MKKTSWKKNVTSLIQSRDDVNAEELRAREKLRDTRDELATVQAAALEGAGNE